ncbi:helix-turn-helix domain-containing protein [Actinokineospora sp. G85]|uniref:helix-turn-helix domain-containing protein n=1 Tax=Actinokineospora sp. G85 TaxID=3406626 RepID=UPI003C75FB41
MDSSNEKIGRRIRELRSFRGLTLEQLAGLSGFSKGYLSLLERGRKPIDKRSTLEAIAAALRVAPSDLASIPWPINDAVAGEARLAANLIGDALAEFRLGDDVEVAPRPWHEIAADVRRLREQLVPKADYAAQGYLIYALVEELLAVYNTSSAHRTDALKALATCYSAAAGATKATGKSSLAWVAADRMISVSEQIGQPEYSAWAAWRRVHMIDGQRRDRQISQAVKWIDRFSNHTGNPQVLQAIGQMHLTTAMAHAALNNDDESATHLREAGILARHLKQDVGTFGGMWFGRTNVAIWTVALAVESGNYGAADAAAKEVNLAALPSKGRRAEFHAEYGRALAHMNPSRGRAVSEILKAEQLAPQLIRNHPLLRETVGGLLSRKLPDAATRELRGIAYRMGIAPIG